MKKSYILKLVSIIVATAVLTMMFSIANIEASANPSYYQTELLVNPEGKADTYAKNYDIKFELMNNNSDEDNENTNHGTIISYGDNPITEFSYKQYGAQLGGRKFQKELARFLVKKPLTSIEVIFKDSNNITVSTLTLKKFNPYSLPETVPGTLEGNKLTLTEPSAISTGTLVYNLYL